MAKIFPHKNKGVDFTFKPSEREIQNQFEGMLPEIEDAAYSGFWEGAKTVGLVAIKVLDIPRILLTDVVGNTLEAFFEAGFDLAKGMPAEAAYAFGRNMAETVTDTYADVFTTDLETRITGDKTMRMIVGDKEFDELPAWLRLTASIGMDLLNDPTTFIGVGAIKSAGTNIAKNTVKRGGASVGKFVVGIKHLSQDTRTIRYVAPIIAAKDIDTAAKMIDDVVGQFGMTLPQMAQNEVVSTLGDMLLDPKVQKLFGYNFDLISKYGTHSTQARNLAAEYGRRAGSNYDEILGSLKGKSVDELVQMGFTRPQAQFYADSGYLRVNIDELQKITGLVKEDTPVALTTEEILDTSRKYGDWVTQYSALFNPNPNVHYWAFSQDLLLDGGAGGAFARSANNAARFLGMSSYANPLWYGKRMLYNPINRLVTRGADGKNALTLTKPFTEPVKTMKSLFGRTSVTFADTAGKVLADPTLGMQVGSQGWLDNLAGKFMFFGAGPEVQQIAEKGFDTACVSYGIQTESFKNYLIEFQEPLKNMDKNQVLDLIQLNRDQWSMRQVLGDKIDSYGKYMDKLENNSLESLKAAAKNNEELNLLDAAILQRETYDKLDRGFADGFNKRMQNLLDMEHEFGIAEKEAAIPIKYIPNKISEGAMDAIEQKFRQADKMDLYHTIMKSSKSEIRDMFISQLRVKTLRDIPTSVVNTALRNGDEAIREKLLNGILEPFKQKDAEAYALARQALDDFFATDGDMLATNLNELIYHRMIRHYTDAQLGGVVGMMKQHGLLLDVGRAELVELRKAVPTTGKSIEEARKVASETKRGIKYSLNPEMTQKATELGYVASDADGGNVFYNITPRDMKAIAGKQSDTVDRMYPGRTVETIQVKDLGDEIAEEHWGRVLGAEANDVVVPKGKTLIVTRSTIKDLLMRSDKLDAKTEAELWRIANDATPGFMAISGKRINDSSLNAQFFLNAARRAGLEDNIMHLVDDDVLKQMQGISKNINTSTMRKSMPIRIASRIISLLQMEKLAGYSTFMANMIGNPIFALQGGLTDKVFSHLKHAKLYAKYLLHRGDMSKIHIKELNMSMADVVERLRADGVIGRGWVRETYEAMQGGGLVNYDKMDAIVKKHSKLGKAFNRTIGAPALFIGATADDGWRFIYAMDCLTNRGQTFEETAQMVKQYMGDFSPEKLTSWDKSAASMTFFYRFRKWNTLNQAKILASDPKWASFIGKNMRAHQAQMNDEERVIAKLVRPEFMDWGVAKRLDGQDAVTWDRTGKMRSAEYMIYNPFGSWYPTYDLLQMSNPLEAFDAVVLAADFDPSAMGFFNNIIGGMTSMMEAVGIRNEEMRWQKFNNSLASFTNATRIGRYIRPMIKNEEGWRQTKERLMRGPVYKQYVDLKQAVSKARSTMNKQEQGVYDHTIRRLNTLMYDLQSD